MRQRVPHWLVPLLLLLLVVSGCGDTRARYGVHMQRGVEAYGRGDYERALIAFEKALQFHKDDPQVHLYIGELCDDYLHDKLRAIAYYNEFLKRSRDETLNARVREWIAQAEAEAVGEQPSTDLVASDDPKAELKELRTKLVQALMLNEKYGDRVHELEAAQDDKAGPPRLPWVIAALCGAAVLAVVVVAWLGRLPGMKRPVPVPVEHPVLKERAILGRYFWVENEFNLGTLAIARENRKIRLESRSLSTNARSTGYGSLDKDTLTADLTDERGLTATMHFRFAHDGMSFTAEWTDDLGPGVAIGVRER